jgi:hypothetical protein
MHDVSFESNFYVNFKQVILNLRFWVGSAGLVLYSIFGVQDSECNRAILFAWYTSISLIHDTKQFFYIYTFMNYHILQVEICWRGCSRLIKTRGLHGRVSKIQAIIIYLNKITRYKKKIILQTIWSHRLIHILYHVLFIDKSFIWCSMQFLAFQYYGTCSNIIDHRNSLNGFGDGTYI